MNGPHIGSLCSGYGGLEEGLRAVVGGTVAWHAEYDDAPSRVLAARFPGVPNHRDITTTDWSRVEPVDWLTAGYPCQPFSHAGKRKGKDDERHLWPFVADAVRVLRPRRLLFENVAGHVSLGLDAVLADLAGLGYVGAWGVLRAADAGAPHGRARVFIVAADARGERHGRGEEPGRLGRLDGQDAGQAWEPERSREVAVDRGAAATDADRRGCKVGPELDGRAAPTATDGRACGGHADGHPGPVSWGDYGPAIERWQRLLGRTAPRPTEPGTRGGERLSPRFVEWLMGLPDGWVTQVPGLSRSAQLRCLGNGVVPQQCALAVRMLLPLLAAEEAVA